MPDMPAIRRIILPPRPPPNMPCIMRRISVYCLISEFTCATVVPEPRTKVIERELVLLQLLELRLSVVLIYLVLNFFDQRQHITHAEDALGDTIGIERFKRVVLLTDTNKFHWLTGDLFDRQGRAA